MAIDVNLAEFLINCQRQGVSFKHSLTLGRLNYYLGVNETRKLLRRVGMDASRCTRLLNYEASRYAETFLETLGAEKVDSLDASNFEGATLVHDLNLPVPESFKGRFDAVCDAGLIEHVINFPVVMRNCMEMVKVGGHLILATPANNYFGHGFFQFSPELWFRLLSPAHGFEMCRMVAVEYAPRPRWFDVADPAAVRDRVTLINRYPVVLLVLAKKTVDAPVFQSFPQQSDYVPRWHGSGDSASRRRALEVRLRRLFLETFPSLARCLENLYLASWFNRKDSLRNRRFFTPSIR
jgi:SAM-dependent methyltransferase